MRAVPMAGSSVGRRVAHSAGCWVDLKVLQRAELRAEHSVERWGAALAEHWAGSRDTSWVAHLASWMVVQ